MRLTALTIALFALSSLPHVSHEQTTQQPPATEFAGRWDLTLHSPTRDYGSWLEIAGTDGEIKGRMVGRWGHAHPVLNLHLGNGEIVFESPRREESLPVDMVFRGSLSGGELRGTIAGPPDAGWTWTGKRAPSLSEARTPRWGRPISLFDRKDLHGWSFNKPDEAANWTAVDGVLKTSAKGSDLISTRKFNDFKLHIEFKCDPSCNSGVYLRGRYEVQIAEASGEGSPDRRAGAVYGFLAPAVEIPITPGTWQTYDITLVGRTVTVVYDGRLVIDRKEIPGVTGGALDSDEGSPGPICLQGSERAGATAFRNIAVTPAIP